jgi:uncharacterized protein YdaU (DUF1376 family)
MDLDWFPFYWRDFDEGTREMTNEEVGAYLRLLQFQWSYGSVPADRDRAARITGERFSDTTWATLSKKFVADPGLAADRLVNLRMQQVRREQEAKSAHRIEVNRENGRRGGLERGRRLRAMGNSEPLSDSVAGRLANGKRNRSREEEEKKDEDKSRSEIPNANGQSSGSPNSRARRSRRAPEDFKIGEALAAWIKAQFPKVHVDTLRAWTKRQLEKFRDHEFNAPRSNWDATFRNWVRGCIERGDLPSGAPKDGGDEEKAWQNTLKTAAIFGASKRADESREAFTQRVNDLNQRRLDDLERQRGR